MAGSLFDQLKKAGLVDEQKAKKVKKQKYQQSKQKKGKGNQAELNDAAKLAAEAAQQKAERDRQLNLERQQQQTQKAAKAELRQLIQSNQLTDFAGDQVFNFADESRVKSIDVNPKVHKQLVSGKLRLARFEGGYALVPDIAAEKIAQRDESVLIPVAESDDSISKEDEDYYAQFAVPDDLVW